MKPPVKMRPLNSVQNISKQTLINKPNLMGKDHNYMYQDMRGIKIKFQKYQTSAPK